MDQIFNQTLGGVDLAAASNNDDPPVWQRVIVLLSILAMLCCMATEVAPADGLIMLTVAFFTALRIISIKEAISGFGNEGMLTVGVLFCVAAGLEVSVV